MAARRYLGAGGGLCHRPGAEGHKGLGLAPRVAQGPWPGRQRPAPADKTSCRAAAPGVPLGRRGSAVNQRTRTYSGKHDRRRSRSGFWWVLVSCFRLLGRVDAAGRVTRRIGVGWFSGCTQIKRVCLPVLLHSVSFLFFCFTEGASHRCQMMKWGSLTMMASNHVRFIWLLLSFLSRFRIPKWPSESECFHSNQHLYKRLQSNPFPFQSHMLGLEKISVVIILEHVWRN